MKALAPGKVVISGAYCVLHGAPAIVSAVNRYAKADTSLKPDWISQEVIEAFGAHPIPHVDASLLRRGSRKLGLGSSAAILVAAMAAARRRAAEPLDSLRTRIVRPALQAHRKAQGGGSGIDVVTSIWGGTLIAKLQDNELKVDHTRLPGELVIEIWASPYATSTAQMLKAVDRLGRDNPALHHSLIATLTAAAIRAAHALRTGDRNRLLASLNEQQLGLGQLGQAANVPIITVNAETLACAARDEGAIAIPAGAGGGDIVLWVGEQASSLKFRKLAEQLEHHKLDAQLEAEGVHFDNGVRN